MRKREIIMWTINIALVGAIILFFVINSNSSQYTSKMTIKSQATTSLPVKSASVGTNTNANIVPKNNTISTTPSYTLAEVSQHNNETSCWTIIDGKIYDITSYIYSHPAGVNKILQGCGVDATKMYGRVGAHDVARLANTFVGNLK